MIQVVAWGLVLVLLWVAYRFRTGGLVLVALAAVMFILSGLEWLAVWNVR